MSLSLISYIQIVPVSIIPIFFNDFQLHMAFAESNIGLLLLMNRGLALLDPDFITKASYSYMGRIYTVSVMDYLQEHILPVLFAVAVMVALIAALMVYWFSNRKLKEHSATIEKQRRQESELRAELEKKQKEYGHPIYIISDDPYRELVYDGVQVPFLPLIYPNTLVCYSYSKSLSLPGERIGYIAVSPDMEDGVNIYLAVCGAGRSLGYVCAPSLFQRIVPKCIGKTADIGVYKKNRDILCDALSKYGYKVAQPDGAFYLFVKALEENSHDFCEKAKKYELLLVPGDSFGYPGYVRISYCVSTEMIEKSLPSFEKLANEYK